MNFLCGLLVIALLPLLRAPDSFGATAINQGDASVAVQKRIERERQFLYRSQEDLSRSQAYVQAAIRGLEKQVDAADRSESSRMTKDIASFLEWYRSYQEWLAENLVAVEEELSASYADEKKAPLRHDRYYSLANGYARLGSQLEERLMHLEKSDNETAQRLADLKMALEYVTSIAFIEERNQEHLRQEKQSDRNEKRRKDHRFERYKDITDFQIALMQSDIKNLEVLRKHFLVLMETGRMELSWIMRKSGDCDVLARLSGVIDGNAPASIEAAADSVVKRYDADIVYFKKKLDEVSRMRSGIVPSGSLRVLDRLETLSEHYDRMKNRYEHHSTWLSEQAGAYRADIVLLQKDRH